ncbi:MAG: ABC-2 family transporter protein [Armatimonadetes bacterium]|nr:ABC-2 family transporter protein [Armatimonadota bacterium]MDE2207894.1 ABC-2 family transporter protein [Armatimonadota bacterium]
MSRGLRYWLNTYREFLRVEVALFVQYRFAMMIWAVWGLVGPLVSLAVWDAAAASRGSAIRGANGGAFATSDFAAYFLTFMVFSHITMSWDAEDFAFRVRNGNLSPRLLKPINPIHRDAASNAAFKVTTGAMMLPLWIALFLILRPTPPASVAGLLLAVPALTLAAVLRFLLQYSLAMLAFWTTRVEAVNQFYYTLNAFLSGAIAPLTLLPGWLGPLARLTPFGVTGSFPVELALGKLEVAQVEQGFAVQLVWIGVAIAVYRAVWRSGIRQYSAVGA